MHIVLFYFAVIMLSVPNGSSSSIYLQLLQWYWDNQMGQSSIPDGYGPLTKYGKLRGAHAAGMPGTFSPPPWVNDPHMHHGTCVEHVLWCMSGSLTSGFLWSWWRGKRSWHSRHMRNLPFYVSGKRPMGTINCYLIKTKNNKGRILWTISRMYLLCPHYKSLLFGAIPKTANTMESYWCNMMFWLDWLFSC